MLKVFLFPCITPNVTIFSQLSIFRTFLGRECPLSELYQIILDVCVSDTLKMWHLLYVNSFKDREAPFILIHLERWPPIKLSDKPWIKYFSNICSTAVEICSPSKGWNFKLDSYSSCFTSGDSITTGFGAAVVKNKTEVFQRPFRQERSREVRVVHAHIYKGVCSLKSNVSMLKFPER